MKKFYPRSLALFHFISCSVLSMAQPANDNCSGAIALPTASACANTSGNTTGATQSLAGCSGNANDDVWYKFTATATTATVTAKGSSSFDMVLEVFSSCGGTSLGCRDNNGTGQQEVKNLNTLTVGATYWVRAYDYGSGTPSNPTFSICITVPPPPSPQDCGGGLSVCADAPFAGNPNGAGTVDDASGANFGCLVGGEHQSSWYYFSPVSTGTIALAITPNSTSTDYDWAIWGPMTSITCPPPGAPLRCSSADGNGTAANITGLGNGATDLSEGSGGDGWVKVLSVVAGEKYIMLIDNWTATSSPFTLDWTLSGGASLNCSVLPIGLLDFSGEKQHDNVLLKWATSTEVSCDHFNIEKSDDAQHFEDIGQVKGAGNSTSAKYYQLLDPKPRSGMNYYRLRQTDYSGTYRYSQTIAMQFLNSEVLMNNVYPNPTSGAIGFDFYSPTKGSIRIQLIDYMGNMLTDEYTLVEQGKSIINTDMTAFAEGIYSLIVSFDRAGYSSVHKVVKR